MGTLRVGNGNVTGGVPFTLAIRGRGDSHDLETRQDGLANAILTPNGGRGSIGVGAVAFDARQSDVIQYGNMSGPLDTDGHTIAVAFRSDAGRSGEARTPSADAEGRVRLRDAGFNVYKELAPTLDASAPHGVGYGMQVRRLTPRECERLQGFPDDYTLIPYNGKLAKDGPRYKALGNSMAVPCMAWIGRRIALVDALTVELEKSA
jgi:DNA (cytosine-5)-methyltransferase 1